MCLLVVLSRTEEDAPLLIGANRDEKLDRPAVAATVLSASDPRILGGRDLLAGGTWLAVNEHGVVAGLTNRPSPGGRDASKRTRGELPLALAAHDRAEAAVEEFVGRFRPADYNAAWLLVGDRRSLYYLELGEDAAPGVEVLAPGVYVLANGPLHQSSPKTDHVHAEVDGLAGRGARAVLEALPRVLADHRVPAAVPRRAAGRGAAEGAGRAVRPHRAVRHPIGGHRGRPGGGPALAPGGRRAAVRRAVRRGGPPLGGGHPGAAGRRRLNPASAGVGRGDEDRLDGGGVGPPHGRSGVGIVDPERVQRPEERQRDVGEEHPVERGHGGPGVHDIAPGQREHDAQERDAHRARPNAGSCCRSPTRARSRPTRSS